MTRTIDITIESIAAGGDGVGRADGLVVFVPRSAQGDRGRVRIEKAGRFARARWESIEQPGPDRIDPPCAHYVVDRCGGCQLQHIGYTGQLEAKSGIIRDALQRIGKRAVDAPAVRASPAQWRYRRKLTLALRRRAVTDRWIAGLHPYDRPGQVFDLADCPITDTRVLDVWREVRAASALLPRETELRGAVRVSSDDTQNASFVLEGGSAWPTHRPFFDAVPSIRTLWWQPDGQSRRQLATRASGNGVPGAASSDHALRGNGAGAARVGTAADAPAADASFVQVNTAMAAELHRHVVSRTLARNPSTVVDAYAGGGDTAVPLAEAGVRITAIELDRDGAARGAARLRAPSRMVQARVEDALRDALPADVILLNPPRLGLHEQVPAILSAVLPATLIYVSCNPATLARDLTRLPGYRLASLVAFDMFPQTAHVETVCELEREPA